MTKVTRSRYSEDGQRPEPETPEVGCINNGQGIFKEELIEAIFNEDLVVLS